MEPVTANPSGPAGGRPPRFLLPGSHRNPNPGTFGGDSRT